MKIKTQRIIIDTSGGVQVIDITSQVQKLLAESNLKDGLATVFIPGSTATVTTIEYEPGLIEDFSRLMEKIAPSNIPYNHDKRWGDGNGFSHVRAALIGPSMNVPFSDGKLSLGTWQQIVYVDFDTRPRKREIIVQVMGE